MPPQILRPDGTPVPHQVQLTTEQAAAVGARLISVQYYALMQQGVPLETIISNTVEHISDWLALMPDQQNQMREELLHRTLRNIRQRMNEKIVLRKKQMADAAQAKMAAEKGSTS